MEREQIIKALTCCYIVGYCFTCPYYEMGEHPKVCRRKMAKDAIAIIKELTEENERLSTALAEYEYKTNIRIAEEYYTAEAYDELREENERLKNICDSYALQYGTARDKEVFLRKEREYTVREMRKIFEERLDISVDGYSTEEVRSEIFDTFDRIANEILNKTEDEEK